MINKKYFSFLFPVPNEYFSSTVKVVSPFEIHVHYSLHWNKKVELERYTVTPRMCKYIVNWDKLEDELLKAAENNSKQYLAPGEIRGSGMRPEGVSAYDDIHEQWERELK